MPTRLSPEPCLSSIFNHHALELSALAPSRLADSGGLSAVVVAAAGAVGMPPLGPPIVRESPDGMVIGMLCRGGHIVLHAAPAEGICYVDIAARAPADVGKGVDVIARRLAPTG